MSIGKPGMAQLKYEPPSASTLRINGPKKPSFGNLLEKRA